MPMHRLGHSLHTLVAETKEFLDDIITAFEKYEGFGRTATASGTDRPGPAPGTARPARGDRDTRDTDELDKLRAELDRLRKALEEVAQRPPKSPAS
ncbi:hypothetical protein [Streptomyces sp. MST-110588]|uniref:hypothetical protein n=1 Tax=Streptomyces sp. MST-110588 TaxID=2833628 RepID=UPI001F5E0BD0|nr:hypothetical protein [Streptomyces sp. MST-110588]UNO43382.1 hypothetical protein KGS77_32750 [Streptomyces sp. MST-110588]